MWWVGVFKSFAALPAQKFGCKIAARSSQRGHLAAIYGLFLLAFSNRIKTTSNGVGAGVGKSGSRGVAEANVDAGN